MSPNSAKSRTVAVWDLPTRIFHWTLAVLILAAWVSYEFAEAIGDVTLKWHRVNGLLILILIVWRVLWGFAGSSTSRFTSFVAGPAAVLGYAKGLVSRTPHHYLGHNPLGALVILALLGVVSVIAAIGLFATDDNDLVGGPLYRLVTDGLSKWLTKQHEELFETILLPLIALHITANIIYGLIKKDPLIPAMITGRKPEAEYRDGLEAKLVSRPLLRAAVCLFASGIIVLGGILALGGSLKL